MDSRTRSSGLGRVLISTKLVRPRVGSRSVLRPRLLQRFDEALAHRVTLISAPPGFGKSTLAAQWLEQQALPCAWLGLDAHDNDLEQFAAYLLASVEAVTPCRLPETTALLAARTPAPSSYLAEVLISELVCIDTPVVLVFEDYHAVQSDSIQQLVERLVPVMPPQVRLVVLTRIDPPWPLGHWRARGWLLELRAWDLRFTLDETREYFAAGASSGLSASAVEQVHDRTEGWVTGLHLVELALRDAPDLEARARSFSGSDHLVADYLVAEVIAAQPPEVRELLAATAPLPRFSAPLADHLLAGGDSRPPATEILHRLQQQNLFLVPLDYAGRWYRYHHLFQELLLNHLPELSSGERRSIIARRAAEWFAREGLMEEALSHWITAGDLDAAAEYLGGHLGAVIDEDISRRQLSRLLALFPRGAEHERLPLLVAQVYLMGSRWDLPGLVVITAEIDELARAAGWPRTAADTVLKAAADVHKAGLTFWRGESQEAVRIASEALEALPPREWEFARSLATAYKALALAMSGRQAEGLKELEQAIAGGSAGDRRQMAQYLLAKGLIHLCAAQMDMVETVAHRMLAAHEVAPVPEFWLGWSHYLRGVVAYERNQMDQAAEAFRQVTAKRYLITTRLVHDALVGLCLVARARADDEGVKVCAADVRAYALEVGDPMSLRIADSLDARLTQHGGGAIALESPPPPDFMSFWLEVPSVTYAERLLQGPSRELQEEALSFIERALEQAHRHHNVRLAIRFSVLRAQALAGCDRKAAALDVLAAVVRQAAPVGLVRTFLDRGPRLWGMLNALAARDGRRAYLDRILSAIEAGTTLGPAADSDARAAVALDGPLSNREIDVLELLGERLSNKEIAERLHVSPETVKVHTRSIYQKLDVHGRREAVVAALSRGLLGPR